MEKQIAKTHTDDRPAETIPEATLNIPRAQLKRMAKNQLVSYTAHLKEQTVRAETRIEVLEAALRGILDCLDTAPLGLKDRVIRDVARAALAAPSGKTP